MLPDLLGRGDESSCPHRLNHCALPKEDLVEALSSRSQKRHLAVALPNFDVMAVRKICRLPFRVVVIRAGQIDGHVDPPIVY